MKSLGRTTTAGRLSILFAANLASAVPASGAEITVGFPGDGCWVQSIQAAVEIAAANAGPDEIQLLRERFFNEQVTIDGNSHGTERITISGGWSDCSPGRFQTADASLFGHGSTDPYVVLDVTNGARVVLDHLFVSGTAGEPGFAPGIGINVSRGGNLEVRRSWIIGHHLTGIDVWWGGTLDIDPLSFVQANRGASGNGGGITCGNPPSTGETVTIAGRVRGNRSDTGAGVRATGSCRVVLADGARVELNEATASGGGIALAGGARLEALLGGPRGISILENTAVEGGGVFLTGAETSAALLNTRIERNEARVGAGVAVRDGAFYQQERGNFIECADPPRCSTLSGNRLLSGSAGNGSALFVGDAEALVMQTYVEGNRGPDPAGSTSRLVHVEGGGSALQLEGLSIWGNEAERLFGAYGGAAIRAGFVSAARNFWSFGNLGVRGAAGVGGGSVELVSSILVDTRGYGGDVRGDCLLVDDDTHLTPIFGAGSIAVGFDPRFVNAVGGDLHLGRGSPAIDFCDSANEPRDRDLDLELRGQNDPTAPDYYGWFDLGSDEHSLAGPVFTDGFESGDLAAWSASGP